MDADAIVRFIWNDEASRPSREAFAKMYDYMQANPDPLPDGVVRKRPAQETRSECLDPTSPNAVSGCYCPDCYPPAALNRGESL